MYVNYSWHRVNTQYVLNKWRRQKINKKKVCQLVISTLGKIKQGTGKEDELGGGLEWFAILNKMAREGLMKKAISEQKS